MEDTIQEAAYRSQRKMVPPFSRIPLKLCQYLGPSQLLYWVMMMMTFIMLPIPTSMASHYSMNEKRSGNQESTKNQEQQSNSSSHLKAVQGADSRRLLFLPAVHFLEFELVADFHLAVFADITMERDYFAFYETLKHRLESLQLQKEALEQELVEYDKYEDRLNATRSGTQTILVDIGEKCFVQAEVEENDVKRSFVHIGLGNYIQFDSSAALEDFIEKRREFLTRKIEYMNSRSELMGADVEQMKQMLEALAAIS